MWSRRILTVLIALLCGLWDATVLPWFPHTLTSLRLALPFVLILASFSTQERAITAAIASGIVLDIFLPSNGGLVSIRFLILALGIHALQQHIFTNRSLIGVTVLGATAVCADRVIKFVFEGIQPVLGRSIIPEVAGPFWAELVWTVCVMVAVFALFAAFSKRFQPLVYRSPYGFRLPRIKA